MKIARFIRVTVVGTIIGVIGGYVAADIVLNLMVQAMAFPYEPGSTASTASTLVGFATAGATVALFQRATGFRALPRWWPVVSAAGWAVLSAVIWVPPLFSLVVGGALWRRRVNVPEPPARIARVPSRFSGFRVGLLAAPAYLIFVGIGHTVLAPVMSARASGPRDGQAFSGTFILGLMLAIIGLFALAVAREGGRAAIARATIVGLVVAVAVVAYTYSRGYDVGGVPGEGLCIVEQGRQVCPSGNGTYIKDARPDVVVIVLAAVGAYALAHVLGRRAAMPPAAMAPAG